MQTKVMDQQNQKWICGENPCVISGTLWKTIVSEQLSLLYPQLETKITYMDKIQRHLHLFWALNPFKIDWDYGRHMGYKGRGTVQFVIGLVCRYISPHVWNFVLVNETLMHIDIKSFF